MPAESPLRNRSGSDFQLIETLRWDPASGFVRLERHLARLEGSARTLGFAHDTDATLAALHEAVAGPTRETATPPLRVRLVLAGKGAVEVAAQPFAPLDPDAVWTLRIAGTRLDSRDPLLRHKTTRRTGYDAARAEFSREEADEAILLNEREEICEGTITSIFLDKGDGKLLTPAHSCGLLPGVLRAEMLDKGGASEAILTTGDLRAAKAIFVCNSLRGLIRARLA